MYIYITYTNYVHIHSLYVFVWGGFFLTPLFISLRKQQGEGIAMVCVSSFFSADDFFISFSYVNRKPHTFFSFFSPSVSETHSRVVHVSSSAHAYGAVPEAVYSSGVRNTDAELFKQVWGLELLVYEALSY